MSGIDCGIDIGSTNVKVVFAGENGRVLHTRSIPSPRITDDHGPVTDALALVGMLEELIIDGWKQFGDGTALRSITAAGVGEDGVGIWSNLTPTGVAIPWFDKRAVAEAQLLQEHPQASIHAGLKIGADRTIAKWLWLHRHRPLELSDATCWIALTDFPSVWWSGRPFMSSSLAPRTACFDVFGRQWISELLSASHAPALPPLLGAGQIVGGVRNGPLRESGAASGETMIVAGGHDHPVAAAMIRRFDAEGRVDSLGTANLVYGETRTLNAAHPTSTIAYSMPATGKAGIACLGVLELSAALAAVQNNTEQLRDYMGASRLAGMPAQSARDFKDASAPRDTLIRRGMEQTSLLARRMFDDMADAGVPKGAIYATGGWSRSRAFVELRASIFGEAIHVIGDMELTAIGAALFGHGSRHAAPGLPVYARGHHHC